MNQNSNQPLEQTHKILLTMPRDMHEWLSERRERTGAPVTELIRRAVANMKDTTTSANQIKAGF
jgi:hypothetical protein